MLFNGRLFDQVTRSRKPHDNSPEHRRRCVPESYRSVRECTAVRCYSRHLHDKRNKRTNSVTSSTKHCSVAKVFFFFLFGTFAEEPDGVVLQRSVDDGHALASRVEFEDVEAPVASLLAGHHQPADVALFAAVDHLQPAAPTDAINFYRSRFDSMPTSMAATHRQAASTRAFSSGLEAW